jgi:RNA polymerase sigma-70 factor (family 1)
MFVLKIRKQMKNSDIIKRLIYNISMGDSDAFRKFYDLFYFRIYRFSGYFVKSDALKEEIVSDVFFNVWQCRKNLEKVENIEAYLYTITRNRALYYLKHKSQETTISIEQLPIGYTFHNETPESIVITEELKQALNDAIAELPERCKLIFLMAKEEGLKYKEIAEILIISEKTVNAQMVTAVKKLSESLRKYMYVFLFAV